MSIRHRHRSTSRPGRLLASLPLLTTLACADLTEPIAPSRPLAAPPATAQPDIYPGTTNTEFSGVQVQRMAHGLAIKFDYTGVVTPAFTVGTGPDVFATQVISVVTKKQAAGYWTATAAGLDAGKLYYFRLDNLKSTWWGSARTLFRTLAIDIDSVRVHNDADPGPGCGEMHIRTIVGGQGWDWVMNYGEYCWHSGTKYTFPYSSADQVYHDFESTEAWLNFQPFERDASCTILKSDCGEWNETPQQAFDVWKSGVKPFVQTTRAGKRLQMTFYGKLIVKYVP